MALCFDRVVLTGSLPDIGHARAMESWLRIHQVRLADYPRWAEPMREETCDNAMKVAAEAGIEIEFIRRLKAIRKEDTACDGNPPRSTLQALRLTALLRSALQARTSSGARLLAAELVAQLLYG